MMFYFLVKLYIFLLRISKILTLQFHQYNSRYFPFVLIFNFLVFICKISKFLLFWLDYVYLFFNKKLNFLLLYLNFPKILRKKKKPKTKHKVFKKFLFRYFFKFLIDK